VITQLEIDEAAVKLVRETKEHFRNLRKRMGYEKAWKEAEDSYFNGTNDYYNGISRVRVPVLHQSCERVVPKLDKVNFPADGDFFMAAAINPKDQIAVQDAEAVTALIKQQMYDSQARLKFIGVYRSLCIYGTVFIEDYWNHKEKKRYQRKDGERVAVNDIVLDNPDFESPSIWDIYVDPKDENLEGALVKESVTDIQEITRKKVRTEDGKKKGVYHNTENLKDYICKNEQDSAKEQSDKIRGVGQHEYGPHEKKVKLLTYWGPVPLWLLTGKDEDRLSEEYAEDALIVVANGKDGGACLRIDDNPFDHQEKPFHRGRYIKIDGRVYGLGIMSVNIPLEAELNTLRNQLMDMRTFLLKKKWIKDKHAGIQSGDLKDINQFVIEADDINGLKEVTSSDFSASGLSHDQLIKQDIEDSTGASKLLSGTPSGSSLDRTAAGVTTVVSGGLERFELVATQVQEELMKPHMRHIWALNQQFLPEGRDIEVTGKGIITVLPELIPLNGMKLNFLGNKELGERQFKLNVLNIALQNVSPLIPLGLDPLPILFRMLKLMGEGDLVHEIDKRPDTRLEETPEGEVQLLQQGKMVKINMNDDHDAYIAAYQQLLKTQQLPDDVRENTNEALSQRLAAKIIKERGPELADFLKRKNPNGSDSGSGY
jgi:hypothetical protein